LSRDRLARLRQISRYYDDIVNTDRHMYAITGSLLLVYKFGIYFVQSSQMLEHDNNF